MFKPNFWKPENPGKGLCKLLKEKAEKGARGENDALMKKGLRPLAVSLSVVVASENDALMKKGLRLLGFFQWFRALYVKTVP